MDLIDERTIGKDPAGDLAFSHALLRLAVDQAVDHVLRIHRPTVPMVVFGRRDTRLPGYPRALEAALDEGFTPAIRATGGRAVAYTPQSLVVDEVRQEQGAIRSQEHRFARFGLRFADMLRELGIDARVGAVPGEYCPGAQSVNARGTSKLVGTAQRVVRDAWLFSSLIVVDDHEQVRSVLTRIYRELDLPFDPASVGSVADEKPELTTDVVEEAVRSHWNVTRLVPATSDLLGLGESLLAEHAV